MQNGASPLFMASLNGHVEMVDKLLQHGARVDLQIQVSSLLPPPMMCIRESVDSLCRDDADMPMPPYIRKAYNCPNAAFVSLFK